MDFFNCFNTDSSWSDNNDLISIYKNIDKIFRVFSIFYII